MLQTFFDVALSCHACQFFIQGLAVRFTLLVTAVIWSHGTYIKLLWNYEFIFYENLLSSFIEILYYENLEPYGNFYLPFILLTA